MTSHGRVFACRVGAYLLAMTLAAAAAAAQPLDDGEACRESRCRREPVGTQISTTLARRWLANPRCREIFVQFRDVAGRTLQERLDSLGETGESYLGRIRFADRAGVDPCAAAVLAMTTPGARVVSLCGTTFAALARRNPHATAVVVLHEELHSLGLGENPPTSQEISRRIETSCR